MHFWWNFPSAGPESGIGNKCRKWSTHRDNGQQDIPRIWMGFGRGTEVDTAPRCQQQPLGVIDVELGQLIRRTSWKMCPCRNIETGTSQPAGSNPLPLWTGTLMWTAWSPTGHRCPGIFATKLDNCPTGWLADWLTGDLDPGAVAANWREILAHKSIGQWICIDQPRQ